MESQASGWIVPSMEPKVASPLRRSETPEQSTKTTTPNDAVATSTTKRQRGEGDGPLNLTKPKGITASIKSSKWIN